MVYKAQDGISSEDLKRIANEQIMEKIKEIARDVNKEEKKKHQSAVFFMLDNTKNGEIVSWYSDKRLANGKVRVIHSYPISGGFCRTYQAYIKLNGAERHTTNNACLYMGSPTWSFYK